MAAPWPLPRALFYKAPDPAREFLAGIGEKDLVYFLLNVGDGDSQVLILPAHRGVRTLFIVDAKRSDKTIALLGALHRGTQGQFGLIADPTGVDQRIIIVGTHPHADHIAGLPKILRTWPSAIDEYWDSGYRHTGQDYERLAQALEDVSNAAHVRLSQPTAGTTRFFGQTRVTALAPAIRLRNQYDTFGIEVNDASIVLRVETPMRRLSLIDSERRLAEAAPRHVTFLLGADAQTHAWASAMIDFPALQDSPSAVIQALRDTVEATEPLRAQVLKLAHHASKRGVNLELVERIQPRLTLVSSKGGGPNFYFPHDVAQETVREALDPIAVTRRPRQCDWAIGMLYTADTIDPAGAFATAASDAQPLIDNPPKVDPDATPPAASTPAGSIAIVSSGPAEADLRVWRFQDAWDKRLRLGDALRYIGSRVSTRGVP